MRQYDYKVLWPESNKYTTEYLTTHSMGGRDPETSEVHVWFQVYRK